MTKGKTLLSLVVVAAWITGAAWMNAQDDHQTLTGVVSTTHCGVKHSTADASQAGCVASCISSDRGGYALVSGGKVYTLEGSDAELAKLAAVDAKVTGHLSGMNMKVEKVEASN